MDVRMAIYEAGIKDPLKLNTLTRIVNLYAYALARKMSGVTLEDAPVSPVRLYPCRGCGGMKPVEAFPESRRANITKGVNCTECQGKREYKCTGPCHQLKPLRDFPERKQASPHLPSPCTYCMSKAITREDAGYSRKESRDSETIPVPAAAGAADRPGVAP